MMEIPRTKDGRPKILHPETGELVTYRRPSTVASVLDDKSNLMSWYGRQAILGIVARPDLYRAVQADPTIIKEIQKKAHEAAASDAAASDGTAVHKWTERLDAGEAKLEQAPLEWRNLLASYLDVTSGMKVIDAETFVVCDELRCGGSYDRLFRLPDGRAIVGDIKTGRWAAEYGANSAAIQTAIYAESKRYRPDTGERAPLDANMDTTVTLMLHMPLAGLCTAYWLDGITGWNGAQLAAKVMGWRSKSPIAPAALQTSSENMAV